RGSTGQAVKDAQQNLVDRGYDIGPAGVDGIFGNRTYHAVIRYQTDRSSGEFWALSLPLDIDGIVGPQTWSRLDPDTVKKGDSGIEVRLLQSILKDFGDPNFDPGPVDGVFGPNTEMAVTKHSPASQAMVWLTQKTGCICGANTGTSIA